VRPPAKEISLSLEKPPKTIPIFIIKREYSTTNIKSKKGAQGTFKTSCEQRFLTIYCGNGPV
jgi:hypothetical protein